MRDEFYYPSKDGNTEIHTIEWKPEGEVKAVLQICHGMVEYMERYDEFANFMCEQGYYVVGNDHLGHGKSIQSKSEYGYFEKKYGNVCVIGDIHTLRQRTMKKYPEVPYFMLGHSMGSALLRQYIQMYGKGLAGVIIMGTPKEEKKITLLTARFLCCVMSFLKGGHYKSKLIDNMALGVYNKHFKPAKTRADWVTSDPEMLDKYVNDPLCSFKFTVNAYYHMFGGMLKMRRKENFAMVPKNLPIYFVSGEKDPVGGFGKGVTKLYHKYRNNGMTDVSLKMYPDARHEVLNEVNRGQVFKDIYGWLESKRM
ncbi:MAG: alpha/beta hydrolase [Hespellia sp.]|nr:alpha/beta hydrolase [Hespellia sp.]